MSVQDLHAQEAKTTLRTPVAVAATVNGTPIPESQVAFMIRQNTAQGQAETPGLRKEVIDHLAVQMLATRAAIGKGLDKDPQVSDQLELARQSILASAFAEDYFKNLTIDEPALQEEYSRIKAGFAGKQYKARHILVAEEAQAMAIIRSLMKSPAAFATLAKAKSQDSGSRNDGGNLGWFDANAMVPEFSAALSGMEKGQFSSRPVKTQFGFHVIQLEDIRPSPLPAFDEVKPRLARHLQEQAFRKLLDQMRAEAVIEIH